MTSKLKTYLIEEIDDEAYDRLKSLTDITDEISESDIVLSRNLKIDKKFIDMAPKLKCIAIHGTGTSECDVTYAKAHGIVVFNAPYQNVEAVAEMNLALALYRMRHLYEKSLDSRDYHGFDLKGKKVGILGYGHIGKRTEELFSAFGSETIVYNRTPKDIPLYDLKEVLRKSDILIVALALNEETRGIIKKEELSLLKRNVTIINTTRGGIIDENDLYSFLKKNEDAYYLSDVFEDEPLKKDNPLLSLPNVHATPHVASNTKDALHDLGKMTVDGIEAFINKKEMKNKL